MNRRRHPRRQVSTARWHGSDYHTRRTCHEPLCEGTVVPGKTLANVGVTQQLPVRVQVNDGKLANVQVIVKQGNPLRGEPEELRELRQEEVIVLSRQMEIGDGQPLRISLEDW
jgi:hypothetical protein